MALFDKWTYLTFHKEEDTEIFLKTIHANSLLKTILEIVAKLNEEGRRGSEVVNDYHFFRYNVVHDKKENKLIFNIEARINWTYGSGYLTDTQIKDIWKNISRKPTDSYEAVVSINLLTGQVEESFTKLS